MHGQAPMGAQQSLHQRHLQSCSADLLSEHAVGKFAHAML